jgi:hypothetical protein
MYKKTITFLDFDEIQQTETLYFNLTKNEIVELYDLQPRLERWEKRIEGPPRDITPDEIRELLSIIKDLISRSYGQRSEDGKRFIKTSELHTEFTQTMAFDEFLFSLFNPPENAFEFITGIVPKALREEALAAMPAVPSTSDEVVELPQPTPETVAASQPAWLREGRLPTDEEISKMDKAEMALAFQQKLSLNKPPQ